MSAALGKTVEKLRESLWLFPVVLSAFGIALGYVLPRIEGLPDWKTGWIGDLAVSGPSGARALLGTAAGALSTVLGVVFSITVVTLQLAAQQYTPRVLRRFMADRRTQLTLGTFIATVAYLLMVLRTVRGEDSDPGIFVPQLSLVLGGCFTLLCLGLVAWYVHHVSRSIQAATLIMAIGKETIRLVRRLPVGAADEGPGGDRGTVVRAESRGYLDLVDTESLFRAAPPGCSRIRVLVRVGDFVLPPMPVLSLHPPASLDERAARRLRRAFAVGRERSRPQDILFGVRQLVDIALKALSPALNDVTSAVIAVNELGVLGYELLRRNPPVREGAHVIRRDGVELVLPTLGLEAFLQNAFREITLAAVDHPRVIERIVELLAQLVAAAPFEEHRRVLAATAKELAGLGGGNARGADREALEERLRWVEAGGELTPSAREGGPAIH